MAWYNLVMKTVAEDYSMDRLIGPLGRCLTVESAKRILKLKADAKLQRRVDELADKCSEGLLTPEERDEHARYVSFGTFVALLKSRARQLLATSAED